MKKKKRRSAPFKQTNSTELLAPLADSRPVAKRRKKRKNRAKDSNGQPPSGLSTTADQGPQATPSPATTHLAAGSHKAAPAAPVRRSSSVPHDIEPWATWHDYLKARNNPVATKSRKAALAPVSWGLALDPQQAAIRQETEALAKSLRHPQRIPQLIGQFLVDWLHRQAMADRSEGFALAALLWARSLPDLAQALQESQWKQLFSALVEAVRDAAGLSIEEHPLTHQLLNVELPLTLAMLLPELAACRRSRKSGWRALEHGLEQLLDGNGIAHARHVRWARALTACWIRCGWLEHQRLDCRKDQLSKKALAKLKRGGLDELGRNRRLQMEWAVREAIRSTRSDGSCLWSPNGTVQRAEVRKMLVAGLGLTGDREDATAAKALLGAEGLDARRRSSLPETSEHSEWAGISVMRSGWKPNDVLLGVQFGEGLKLDLSSGRDRLLAGPWTFQAYLDGRAIHPPRESAEYEEVCWFSDEDCDYLELETELSDGWMLQRQLLLDKEDKFLYLADAVVGPPDGSLDGLSFASTLTLAPDIGWRPAKDTREGQLVGRGTRWVVLPLNQPEWRNEAYSGGLSVDSSQLQWTIQQAGAGLYAAVWINLNAASAKQPHTWRRLTVAQNLAICHPYEAVAYRVQQGKNQWFFYRSLRDRAIRSALGQNLHTEFFASRFLTDGSVRELVAVE